MKKGLTILIACIILLTVFSSVAVATDVMLGRSFSAEGTGIVNIDLEVATEQWSSGLKLDERMSTLGGGITGNKYIDMQYSSTFVLEMYNMTGNTTDNSTNILEYYSEAKASDLKRTVYTKNYILGNIMGFESEGYSNQMINMYSEDEAMEVDISGKNSGDLILFQKVIDASNAHNVLVYDVSELKGEYIYNWSAYAEKSNYPAAYIGDWLGCP